MVYKGEQAAVGRLTSPPPGCQHLHVLPGLCCFPEAGWNYSLAQNEAGLHGAFPQASDKECELNE